MKFEISKTKTLVHCSLDAGETEVIVPDEVRALGQKSFSHDSQVKTVFIHEKVNKITVWGFYDCMALQEINVSENNKKYSSVDGVLYNKDKTELLLFPAGRTEYTIPDGVQRIGDYAFSGCKNLTKITIPKTVISLGKHAFRKCRELEAIDLPENISEIGSDAFSSCTNLKKVTIPEGVTVIGFGAFSNCTSLTEVAIPESVNEISYNAFSNCTSLTEVTIPEGVSTINSDAFSNCTSLTEVHIPASVTNIDNSAFEGCTCLKNIEISPENKCYTCKNGKIVKLKNPSKNKTTTQKIDPAFSIDKNGRLSSYDPDKDDLDDKCDGEPYEEYLQEYDVFYPEKASAFRYPSWATAKVPDTVRTIGKLAFSNAGDCTAVIKLPESVEVIEDRAFESCMFLATINIPSQVTKIGTAVFNGCYALKAIRFTKCGKKFSFDFDYKDYDTELISWDKVVSEKGAEQMDLLSAFMIEQDENKCREIVDKITNDRIKADLEAVIKKAFKK